MKKLLLGMLLGILLVSGPLAYTQQQQEQISIGTTSLQLGMAKDAVISKLAELGYEFSKETGTKGAIESWAVTEKNRETDEYDLIGSLAFKDRRLVAAGRVWANSWDASSANVSKNLYFLFKSFQAKGDTSCQIETFSQESPEFETKNSLIHCGRRTISIVVSKYKDQNEETQLSESVK